MAHELLTILDNYLPEGATKSVSKLSIELLDLKTIRGKNGIRRLKKRYTLEEIQKALKGYVGFQRVTTYTNTKGQRCALVSDAYIDLERDEL